MGMREYVWRMFHHLAQKALCRQRKRAENVYFLTRQAVTFSSYGAFWLSLSSTFHVSCSASKPVTPLLALYIPQFGVAAAYAENPAMLENALGLYLCVWGIVTVLFLIASHRSSVVLICIFGALSLNFFILWVGYRATTDRWLNGRGVYWWADDRSAGYLSESPKCIKTGSAIGIVSRSFCQNFFSHHYHHHSCHVLLIIKSQITAIFGAYTSLAELVTADTGFFRVPIGNLTPKDH